MGLLDEDGCAPPVIGEVLVIDKILNDKIEQVFFIYGPICLFLLLPMSFLLSGQGEFSKKMPHEIGPVYDLRFLRVSL